MRLDPDLRGGLEGEGGVSQGEIGPRPEGRDFLKRREFLCCARHPIVIINYSGSLYYVSFGYYGREPMIKEGKSGVKM